MPGDLPCVDEIEGLRGKRVLLRATLNLPVVDGVVENTFRLEKTLPTIEYLVHHGAHTVIIGHVGRDPKLSLRPVSDALQQYVPHAFVERIIGEQVTTTINALCDGDVIMLENLRSIEGEQGNDEQFAQQLASYGDVFVNEAFSNAHREHASAVGVPKFLPSYIGFRFKEELQELSDAREPQAPALCILGGAKFETKEPLVVKFITDYDRIFIGGALANDLFKAQGYEVGTSLVSEHVDAAKRYIGHPKILLPTDVVVDGKNGTRTTVLNDVASHEAILDAGPQTIELLQHHVQKMKTILWNGPLGNYENGFDACSKACAHALAKSSAHTVVGGGDTVAAIDAEGLNEKFNFISTGGGAMLIYLEKGTLPAIEAIKTSHG